LRDVKFSLNETREEQILTLITPSQKKVVSKHASTQVESVEAREAARQKQ